MFRSNHLLATAILLSVIFQGITTENPDKCWIKAYPRAAGITPNSCPSDYTADPYGTCHQFCRQDFDDVLNVCWAKCMWGTDTGAFCAKGMPQGRGWGYWIDGGYDKCIKENPGKSCELIGLFYYPSCNAGFRPFGPNVCTPVCPPNTTDVGDCAKNSYLKSSRAATCAPNTEKSNDKCFPKCNPGNLGYGRICVSPCPNDYTQYGAACVKNTVKDKIPNEWRNSLGPGYISLAEAFIGTNDYKGGFINFATPFRSKKMGISDVCS
jgi:hypothetical protein